MPGGDKGPHIPKQKPFDPNNCKTHKTNVNSKTNILISLNIVQRLNFHGIFWCFTLSSLSTTVLIKQSIKIF